MATTLRIPKTGQAAVTSPGETDDATAVVPPKQIARKVDAFNLGGAPRVQGISAVDGKLAAAYGEFQRLLGIVINTGTWKMLDGTTPAWGVRQLLDVRSRFGPLAMDPAKGKMSPGSVEEAAIGLAAERAGVVPGPITREATGQAEFVDALGKFWDVKSPVSPWAGAKWTFDAEHQVVKVKHDISQDNTVLLNLARLTSEDTAKLLQTLSAELTPDELERVVTLTTPEVVTRE